MKLQKRFVFLILGILIEGGPSFVVLEKLGNEMPFWDRDIDLIILTHPEHS